MTQPTEFESALQRELPEPMRSSRASRTSATMKGRGAAANPANSGSCATASPVTMTISYLLTPDDAARAGYSVSRKAPVNSPAAAPRGRQRCYGVVVDSVKVSVLL